MKKRLKLGVLGRPQGLKGAIRLKTEAEPEVIEGLTRVYLEGHGWRAVEHAARVGDQWVLKLLGVEGRSAAEALTGTPVYAEAGAVPALEAGRYYYHELIGRPVFVHGEPFGEVRDLRDAGAQDLLVVARGLREYLVPLQAPYVRVEEEGIFVEPPEGLFE